MRLARLDLERYGRFTDVSVDLPRQATDLHVIFGPNEAGKSTTRRAVTELLYGYAKSTPFAFLHDYADLRLRARVETGNGEPMDIVRLKKAKASLTDAAGKPIDDATWSQVIGPTDRAFFERMFALDHGLLVAGGQAMLDSRSDLGRMLFQAAAGLSHFNQVRAALGDEAAQYWTARSRKDVRYFEAKARVEAAAKALKDHGVSESALASLQRTLAQAEAQAGAARDRSLQASVRIAQLERIRRVAPKLRHLAQFDTELEALASAPLLPIDARETLRAVLQDVAKAESAATQLGDSIGEQVQRRDALCVDEGLLRHADTIDALDREMSSVEKEVTDLPKRKVQREDLRRKIAQAVADLGISAMEPTEVARRLPNGPQRERLREMARQHADHQKALASARSSLESASSTAASHRRDLERAAVPSETSLDELLANASSVLDSANARQLAEAVGSAESALRAAIDELGWTGTAEALRAVRPPDRVHVTTWLERLAQHRAIVTDVARARRDVDAEIAEVAAELAVRRQGAVPDLAALQGARSERDHVLDDMIAGRRQIADEGEGLRGLVQTADEIADRRYAEAEVAANMDRLMGREAGLRTRAAVMAGQAEAAEICIGQVQAEWAAAADSAGMAGVSLDGALAWLKGRLGVLQLLDSVERARAADADFSVLAERAAAALVKAIPRERPDGVAGAAWLQSLVTDARAAQKDAVAQRSRRAELERLLDEQENLIARGKVDVDRLTASEEAWRSEWQAACTDAGMPAGTLPGALEPVLQLIEDLRTKAAEFTELVEARIQPMERNVAAYHRRVQECVAAAAPTLSDRAPFEAVRAMAKALRAARQAASTRESLDETIELQRGQQRQQMQQRDAELARLAPLLTAARASSTTELDAAVTASDERRRLEAERAGLVTTILESGDGHDIAQLRETVASVALDQLDVLIIEAQQDRQAADEQMQAAQGEAVLARDRLRQLDGDDHAARARVNKLAAQREMADAVEAFVGLQTQSLLLDWALKRYREERQGPLLQRASDYFAKLTCGEHARLIAEEEDGAVSLWSRRAGQGNARIGVDAMSEGTRDQLYLALRLAALESHLERNVALPFIADDLLVNFDDGRASAALSCLAELSQRTQVLYFTHHQHLLDLARERVDRDINIVALC